MMLWRDWYSFQSGLLKLRKQITGGGGGSNQLNPNIKGNRQLLKQAPYKAMLWRLLQVGCSTMPIVLPAGFMVI